VRGLPFPEYSQRKPRSGQRAPAELVENWSDP